MVRWGNCPMCHLVRGYAEVGGVHENRVLQGYRRPGCITGACAKGIVHWGQEGAHSFHNRKIENMFQTTPFISCVSWHCAGGTDRIVDISTSTVAFHCCWNGCVQLSAGLRVDYLSVQIETGPPVVDVARKKLPKDSESSVSSDSTGIVASLIAGLLALPKLIF